MPNCFQLIRKSDPAAGPVSLAKIDDEMCEHFGVKPDPVNYYRYWYDVIGFAIACGRTFDDLRARYSEPPHEAGEPRTDAAERAGYLAIVNWLDEHFTSDAWAEIGRR